MKIKLSKPIAILLALLVSFSLFAEEEKPYAKVVDDYIDLTLGGNMYKTYLIMPPETKTFFTSELMYSLFDQSKEDINAAQARLNEMKKIFDLTPKITELKKLNNDEIAELRTTYNYMIETMVSQQFPITSYDLTPLTIKEAYHIEITFPGVSDSEKDIERVTVSYVGNDWFVFPDSLKFTE